jgi:GxxExxY protein
LLEAKLPLASLAGKEQARAKGAKGAKVKAMKHDEIARLVVECAFALHKELGPGLLESVYEVLLADALRERGLAVERQKPIPICFRGKRFDEGFRADLLVGELVLVELKSVETLARVHRKQVLTYLRLTGLQLGLLINFGGELLKGNIERMVNGLEEPPIL